MYLTGCRLHRMKRKIESFKCTLESIKTATEQVREEFYKDIDCNTLDRYKQFKCVLLVEWIREWYSIHCESDRADIVICGPQISEDPETPSDDPQGQNHFYSSEKLFALFPAYTLALQRHIIMMGKTAGTLAQLNQWPQTRASSHLSLCSSL